MDMIAFIVSSISAIVTIIGDMLNLFNNSTNPVNIFILIYMINLLFYRICMEINTYKLSHVLSINIIMHALTLIAVVSTILLVIYLIISAVGTLWGCGFIEILGNHITYATIVGSWFIIHLASDSMTALYNTYIKK
jgi:hypothetical protein